MTTSLMILILERRFSRIVFVPLLGGRQYKGNRGILRYVYHQGMTLGTLNVSWKFPLRAPAAIEARWTSQGDTTGATFKEMFWHGFSLGFLSMRVLYYLYNRLDVQV